MILSFIVDVVVDANVVDDVDVDNDLVPPALWERDCGSGQERHLELPSRGGRQQNGGWPIIFWRSQWSWLGLLLDDLEEDYFNFCLSRFHGSGTRTLIYSRPEGAISNNPYDSVFYFQLSWLILMMIVIFILILITILFGIVILIVVLITFLLSTVSQHISVSPLSLVNLKQSDFSTEILNWWQLKSEWWSCQLYGEALGIFTLRYP